MPVIVWQNWDVQTNFDIKICQAQLNDLYAAAPVIIQHYQLNSFLLQVCLLFQVLGSLPIAFHNNGDGRGWVDSGSVTLHNLREYLLLTAHRGPGAPEPGGVSIQTGKCQNFCFLLPSPHLIPSWHYLMWWVTLESSIFSRKNSLLST